MSKNNVLILIEDTETGDIEERYASNFLTYRASDYLLRQLLPTPYDMVTSSGLERYGYGYMMKVSKWGLGHDFITGSAPYNVDLDTKSVTQDMPFMFGEDSPTRSGWNGATVSCQSTSYDRRMDYFPIEATISNQYYTDILTDYSAYVAHKLVLEAGFKSTGITNVGTAASLSTITYSQVALYHHIPHANLVENASFEIRNPSSNAYVYSWTTSDVMFAWTTLSSPITKSATNRVTLQWTVSFA